MPPRAAPKACTRELVSPVFEQPCCRISDVTARRIARRQTASVHLKELVRIGVLEENTLGRDKLFVHPKLMRLLTRDTDDFGSYR